MSIPTPNPAIPDLRALTVEDLVMMQRISDPRLSPDGRRLAYSLRETDLPANKGLKSLWLLDLDHDNPVPRKLSGGGDAGSNSESPRWAPDGQSLYFLSNRSGTSQVWLLPMTAGEARAVTRYPLDVNAYAVSPDGRHLAVAMEVFPECATLACSRNKLDELAARKTSGQLYEQLFMRHWDTWKNGSRAQLFIAALDADGVAPAEPLHVSTGIAGDVPSKPFGGDEEFAFSPDGQTLVFAARVADRSEAWSTNLDLYRVPVDGSKPPENLTAGNLATDTGPVFSPDGRTLAWRAMKRPGFEADRYGIWLMDWASGKKKELAPDWDRSAETLAFSPRGEVLYTTAEDTGQKPLFAIDINTGLVQRLTEQGTVSAFAVAASTNGDQLVYALNTLTRPDQLFRKLTVTSPAVELACHNQQRLRQIGFSGFEQFSFAGWNSEIVHGYVHKPYGYRKGEKYPVAFLIHGGPQGSLGNDWHYRWNPQVFAGMGYAVVAIDFHGSTGYGQKFTDSISGDWGGKPLEDLQKGWTFVQGQYDWLDGTRAAALGASYGGYMVNWIAGHWPDAFRCLVNHDGVFDNRMMSYSTEELWFDEWEHGGTHFEKPTAFEKHNPVNHVARWNTPMLVIHGGTDFRVPCEQGIATFTALQRRGIPSQFLYFPDENHWVLKPQNSIQWHQTVRAWLDRWTRNR